MADFDPYFRPRTCKMVWHDVRENGSWADIPCTDHYGRPSVVLKGVCAVCGEEQ